MRRSWQDAGDVQADQASARCLAAEHGVGQPGGHTAPAASGLPAAGATVADLGEAALLDRIRARVPERPRWVRVGIGDDGAVVEPARNALEILTTDALVEGVHFDRAFTTLADVGHKALAVNLSDLAAMGAAPRAALLTLALPPTCPVADVDALVDAFLALAARHQTALVGGNLTRSPGPIVVDVTVTGTAKPRRALSRAGGRAGDDLYVSGALGGAAAGLASLRAGIERDAIIDRCQARYRRPEPRVRLGLMLGRNRAAAACIDLSDGFADAVRQLARASGAGALVDGDALPIEPGAARWAEGQGQDPLAAALAGGEEYELLFAVPRKFRGRLAAVRSLVKDVPITRVGQLTADRALLVRRQGGDMPLPAGYAHF